MQNCGLLGQVPDRPLTFNSEFHANFMSLLDTRAMGKSIKIVLNESVIFIKYVVTNCYNE